MADVDLNLTADTTDALKQIQTFTQKSSDSLEGLEKTFKDVEKSASDFAKNSSTSANAFTDVLGAVKIAAAALVAVFASHKLAEFFEESVKAASDQDQAIQKLNTALAVTGDYSEDASKGFQEFASSLEKTTGASETQTLNMVALAKSFGATNEQAEKIVQTATDFAAVSNKSIPEAVNVLSASLSGVAKGLSKFSGDIKDLTASQLQAGDAIDIIASHVTGAAEAFSNTYAGAVIKADNANEQIHKSIGELITQNPIVVGFLLSQAEAHDQLAEKIKENKDAIIDFTVQLAKTISTGIVNFIKAIGDFADQINLGIIVLKGLVVGLSAIAEVAYTVGNTIISVFSRVVATAFAPLLEVLNVAAKGFATLGIISDSTADIFSNFVSKATQTIANGSNVFGGAIDLLDKVRTTAAASLDQSLKSNQTNKKSYDELADTVQHYTDGIVEAGQKGLSTSDAFQKISDGADKSSRAFENTAAAVKQLANELKTLENELDKAAAKEDPIKGAEDEESKRLKIIQDSLAAGLIAEQKFNELKAQINIDTINKIAEAEDKAFQEQEKEHQEFLTDLRKSAQEALNNPIISPDQADSILGTASDRGISATDTQAGGQLAGITTQLLAGAQGASKLLASAVGTIADTLLPGIGSAVSGIVGVLAQGPDAVKALVTQFLTSLPTIVVNIAKSIPAIIQAIADNIPQLIVTIINDLPQITVALIKLLPTITKAFILLLPEIAIALIKDLQQNFTAAGIKENLQQGSNTFKDNVTKASNDTSNAFKSAGQFISNAGQNFIQFIEKSGSEFYDAILKVIDGFSTGIQAVGGSLFQAITDAFSGVGPILDGIFAIFKGNFLDNVNAGLKGIFDNLAIKLPEFNFPPFPPFQFPSLPDFKFPAFPPLPTFKFPDAPTLKLPSLPTLKVDIPKIEIPNIKIDIPDIKIDLQGLTGGGGGATSFLGSVGKTISSAVGGFLASGGTVPSGFPNDTFPAHLSSGETVIDRALNDRLERFLDSQDSGQSGQTPVNVTLKVGEKQLADVLLNINRQGFRTA